VHCKTGDYKPSCITWMFRIPNYIAVWKNEIETSLKACLKFPKRKWIDTSLFSNRPTGDELV
jgi:hypothetical protein